MKLIIKTIFIVACLISYNVFAITNLDSVKKVLISQVVDHPALNITTQGIIDGLADAGFKRGENLELRVESAQGNAAVAAQIANKFVSQKPDVVVGVGTLSAQSFAKYTAAKQVKLIFSSVTDPVAANIVKNLQNTGNNTSGVSNFVNLKPQLELFKDLQPSLKRLGVIYNPGEINSITVVKKLEHACKDLNIVLIKQTAARTADVAQAAVKLAAHVDAILISNDNTALSSLQSIIRSAVAAKIPVYVSDTDAVEFGAVAALGPNQFEIGRQTGRMIAQVLNGADPDNMAVEFPKKTDLYINLQAATKANIHITKNILDRATLIIEKTK